MHRPVAEDRLGGQPRALASGEFRRRAHRRVDRLISVYLCRVRAVTQAPTPKITSQVAAVLDALTVDAGGDHWGFEIIKRTGIKSGTVYPILARLEASGWVTSGWANDSSSGPRRRYYRLTGEGEKAASNIQPTKTSTTRGRPMQLKPVVGPA
jgi:PadR family transcriptional regulator, regulatory protein PadR